MAIKEHVIFVNKHTYWLPLVSHYYDSVHWDVTPRVTIYEWLYTEYGALTDMDSEFIFFNEQKRANWFHLRWHPNPLLTDWSSSSTI